MKRVPLSIALSCLLTPAVFADEPHPPIGIPFTLEEPGFVTLVIEDANGNRVRNLISETEFSAGKQMAWWDGLDDLTPDKESAAHAIYHIAGKLVAPGSYRVRGLVRPKLDLTYEMTADTNGNPPWKTAERSSEWLANHTPPSAVLFVPEKDAPKRAGKSAPGGQIIVGSFVSEGGSGVAWLDLDGKKLHGQLWIGGVWTGATQLARDEGDKAVPGVYAYTGASWTGDKYNGNRDELRLHELVSANLAQAAPHDSRFGTGEDRRLLTTNYQLPPAPEKTIITEEHYALGGLAVHNGLLVAALPDYDRLVFVDAAAHKPLGTAQFAEPHGLAFDKQGRVLVLSGKKLVRVTLPKDLSAYLTPDESAGTSIAAGAAKVPPLPLESIVSDGLEEPRQLTLDADGSFYVSDWGESHQVKVFSPHGKFLRAIGEAGRPPVGPYHPGHMNHPNGVTISSDGHLWVAETDKTPKRVSVWTLDGNLVKALYGPTQYGGGGVVDSLDKTRFFYGDDGGGMEMKLDYEHGTSEPVSLYYRPELSPLGIDTSFENIGAGRVPQTPLHVNGKTYLTDCYTANPTGGTSTVTAWILENGIARPVAAIGRANASPLFGMNGRFCVRWKGQIVPQYSEEYTLQLSAEDGACLWIDGRQVINDWKSQQERKNTCAISLEAGKRYNIEIQYHHARANTARVSLIWSSEHQKKGVVPKDALYPTGSTSATGTGLQAEYFEGDDFSTRIAEQIDPTIDFSWGREMPAPLITERIKAFRSHLPAGVDLKKSPLTFAWSDLNDDGKIEPDEVTFLSGDPMSVTLMPDLTAVAAGGMIFKPQRFTAKGAPVYDAAKAIVLDVQPNSPASSGGGQALVGKDGALVLTTAPKPFTNYAIGGLLDGKRWWSYPNLWPGLHASHNAAMPEFPGELIGPTRLIGPPFAPGGGAGELFAINGNKGNVYLLTTDGLFVATLFRDCRSASWNAPEAKRGMAVDNLSLHEECFWPSISQNADGNIYLQAHDGCISRISGLDRIQRIPSSVVEVTAPMLREASAYFCQREAQRQSAQKPQGPLVVALRDQAPVVDGKVDDWVGASWVTINQRTSQVGDWGHRQAKTEAALAIAGDRLFVAVKTDDPKLLNNSGESLPNLFKTGGCLDLMIGTDPSAEPKRKQAAAGDERLLVTRVKGMTVAVLYRPVASGGGESVAFSSPLRTIKFDCVEDVSADVILAGGGEKEKPIAGEPVIYEFSIPLAKLGLTAIAGQSLRGDVGILAGDGVSTLQRLYWSNKATGLTSDVPSEAELTPSLWGVFEFKHQP